MNRLVDQARTYLGTPYRHRGRTERGLDCVGLPWRCYADLGVELPDKKIYGREPYKDGLMDGMSLALGPPIWRGVNLVSSFLQAGDVAVLAFVKEPHHMGIVGDDPIYGLSLIHSDGMAAKCVIEQGMDERLLKKIVAVFRRPV